jgi:hypothetical protein
MNLTKWTSLAIALTWLTAPAIADSHLKMTIRILDQANLSAAKLQKMERYVERTLASIEVDMNWVDCKTSSEVCKAARGTNEFWLRILAQRPPAVNGGVDLLGFTQHGDKDGIQCVNIFYPMVEELSEREQTDLQVVFGAAVVHEVGHLYLGNNGGAHSQSGVMSGIWSHREFRLASIGELNFTRAQGLRIRAAMNAVSGF